MTTTPDVSKPHMCPDCRHDLEALHEIQAATELELCKLFLLALHTRDRIDVSLDKACECRGD